MQETKRMADEAERMGEEAQEQAGRMGQDFQKAALSRHGSARSMLGLELFQENQPCRSIYSPWYWA